MSESWAVKLSPRLMVSVILYPANKSLSWVGTSSGVYECVRINSYCIYVRCCLIHIYSISFRGKKKKSIARVFLALVLKNKDHRPY